jgi:hypothetical protein
MLKISKNFVEVEGLKSSKAYTDLIFIIFPLAQPLKYKIYLLL